MKFTYTFQVSVHHVLRVKVVQATGNTYELEADMAMVIIRIVMDRPSQSLTSGRRLNCPSRLRNSEIFPFCIHFDTMHSGRDAVETTPRNERTLGWERSLQTTISLHQA